MSKMISANFINGLLIKNGDNQVTLSPFGTISSWENFINVLYNGSVYNPIFTKTSLTMDVEWSATGTSYLIVEDGVWGRYRIPLERA